MIATILKLKVECGMSEEQFPTWTKHMGIIWVDNDEKPTREEILEQMMNQEPIISDEEAFLRHLIKEWSK